MSRHASPSPRRTSLARTGGAIRTRGDARLAELLASAWRAACATPEEARELTHGFHAYPARSPPHLVRVLVGALSRPGDLVLDPFCGSGTTLVEAFAAGRRGAGCDVNEVAVRIARQKTRRTAGAARAAVLADAGRIARRGLASARQREGAGAGESSAAPPELRAWFEPHVWRELDALGRAIEEVRSAERHGTLLLILSSLLTKVSRRRAETSEERVERRLAPGFVSRLFAARAQELVEGLAALAAAAPRSTPPPLVVLGDARELPVRPGSARLVVTSPPYLGTYDYSEIQRLRAGLLALPLSAARRHEVGGRSAATASPRAAIARFQRDLARGLGEIARALAPGGCALVVIGDSRAGAERVAGDELIESAAREAGLAVAAAATQEPAAQPPLRGREHLIALAPR